MAPFGATLKELAAAAQGRHPAGVYYRNRKTGTRRAAPATRDFGPDEKKD